MFYITDVIGWLGNVGGVAVVKTYGGYLLVDWGNSSKRLFIAE